MTLTTSCEERLERYFRDERVPFFLTHHARAYSAQEVAASAHVPGQRLADVVLAVANGRMVMLVLSVAHLVQLGKLAEALGTGDVRLAREREFSEACPDCEPGAMPPFGNLYGLPVYVDAALAEADTIVFRAGTHTNTLSLTYADFARLVRPTVLEFARHRRAAEAEETLAMEPPERWIRTRPIRLLILYYSRFGVLKLLAEQIAEGARAAVPGADVECAEIEDTSIEQLRPGESQAHMQARRASLLDKLSMADALIVGSPAYFGSMASPVKRLFEDCLVASGAPPAEDRSRPWRAPQLRDKVGAAFTASATPHGGNEQALQSILTLFMHLGMLVVTPGQLEPILENVAAPYGATVVTGASGDHAPTEMEQDAARKLGQRVARLTTWLRLGRTVWEQSHVPFTAREPARAIDSARGADADSTT